MPGIHDLKVGTQKSDEAAKTNMVCMPGLMVVAADRKLTQ
ncbi:hypothetical protein PSTAB_2789 [Stutzerimonas stutzeri]|uniref:Uncharacterized protein n=1 Tax=Stutzerimonas stutzeri (strain ATCC 17588 / DSM 5190 / CCUG 11256 / JCM 5965 / LMG 11199 / NBRC 14165 / NCIMB 11358 / Stanier 221) TaxID=96563 RepID=F8H5Q3_STUS2|nr:hypothetical protein PSTAB_2789 [Stutzerimonas stutzeri]